MLEKVKEFFKSEKQQRRDFVDNEVLNAQLVLFNTAMDDPTYQEKLELYMKLLDLRDKLRVTANVDAETIISFLKIVATLCGTVLTCACVVKTAKMAYDANKDGEIADRTILTLSEKMIPKF